MSCLALGLGAFGGQLALRLGLEHKANVLGKDWAHYIETQLSDLGAVPTDGTNRGATRAPTVAQMASVLTNVFAVGHIFQVDYFGLDCACHVKFDARALAEHQPTRPHTHNDDDDHHGMNQPVRHAQNGGYMAKVPAFGNYPSNEMKLRALGLQNAHNIEILNADSPELPSTFASVHHTVSVGGNPAYILRVMVNLERQKTQFTTMIFGGMVISALIFLVGIGYPTWRLFKSMNAVQEADARAGYLATHDVLTGLQNRNSFQETFPKMIRQTILAKRSGLLFLFDLNGFKEVNDFYGHDLGDALLVDFAKLLVKYSPESAYIARLGGDEFVVVLANIPELADDPAQHLELPLKLSKPTGSGQDQVSVGIAGGVARFPEDGDIAADLVQMADLALYAAKPNRGGEIKAYTPEMREAFQDRLSQKEAFRKALKRREIIPHFQPIVNASTGLVEGFEALARWQHPKRGLLSPAAFSEALKDGELSGKLGIAMFMQVVDHMADWQARGIPFKRVAMNASSGDLKRTHLADEVLDLLEHRGLSPSLLTIEVTENCLFGEEKPIFIKHLEKLRRAGCNIALDDFGTGYSSITQLKELPISIVKIDKSFIDNILDSRDDQSIIDALQSLSVAMQFDLVLEGVETAEQLDYLKACGFTLIQGYYFSRPIPEDEVGPFIAFQNNRERVAPLMRKKAGA
ncbi:MAG: EAL domain-containing protein [Pseudomonadota bacterium]